MGMIRIIAGQWRGRRLRVPAVNQLRPTPDRVRETVFNWLMSVIEGAYCLDLFAGSGAFGFEALSRGAAVAVMVDQSAKVVTLLREASAQLGANALIYRAVLPKGLRMAERPFDIVFLDPPYRENLLLPCCHYLEDHGFLAKSAYIYLEAEEAIQENALPASWRLIKCQKAGQVAYHLAQRGC